MKARRDPGSFRDPGAHVLLAGDRVYRALSDQAFADYCRLKESGAYGLLTGRRWLLPAEPIPPDPQISGFSHLLEQPRLPFVSYPYEWPFGLLKRAALFHLDVNLALLERGISCCDASAYNVQFIGPKPVFVDISSFRGYREGEYWEGQRQFMEQFTLPLLLTSLFDVPHHPWYRGRLEGIALEDFAALLRWHHRLSLNIAMFIDWPARLNKGAITKGAATPEPKSLRPLPKPALQQIFQRLRDWIGKLEPRSFRRPSLWGDYAEQNSYKSGEEARKKAFVHDFIQRCKPETVWDLGCNTGAFSEVALRAGARRAIGFDGDTGALERAIRRAEERSLDFLPLQLDLANPSPSQGWGQAERQGLAERASANALLALALEHHLAIGRNIPLPHLIGWLLSLAPSGVVEFVPKSDPMIQRMLRFRADIFADYTQEQFEQALAQGARILRTETVSEAGRVLYAYERK